MLRRRPSAPHRRWPLNLADARQTQRRDRTRSPTPLIGIDRNASPLPDRADLNIAVADAPNFLA
jgi:hypothetical protein